MPHPPDSSVQRGKSPLAGGSRTPFPPASRSDQAALSTATVARAGRWMLCFTRSNCVPCTLSMTTLLPPTTLAKGSSPSERSRAASRRRTSKTPSPRSRRAKKLRRYALRSSDRSVPFRVYGSPNSIVGTQPQQFDQDSKAFDQIYGFSLAGSLGLTPKTLCAKYVDLAEQNSRFLSPNLIVTLDDDQVVTPLRIPPNRHIPEIAISAHDANAIYCVRRPEGGFQFLLSRIYTVYRQGRTVAEVAFDRYFAKDGQLELPSDGTVADLK